MNYLIMNSKDLLRYSRPTTDLETALYIALGEQVKFEEVLDDLMDLIDVYTHQDLEEFIKTALINSVIIDEQFDYEELKEFKRLTEQNLDN